MNIEILKYNFSLKETWNDFNMDSFNGTFLFNRNYMDYHSERFEDYSLLIYEKNELKALISANKSNDEWLSHQGLTYGGLILKKTQSQTSICRYLKSITDYLIAQGFRTITYKALPQIYYPQTYYSIEYALFKGKYKLIKKDASTTIFLENRDKLTKGRKSAIKKAEKQNLVVNKSQNFELFFELENENLKKKYNAISTHTAEEMNLLYSYFPNNINLYTISLDNSLLAGAIVYNTGRLMHLQYFAISENGEKLEAGSLLLAHLIKLSEKKEFKIFDFGISTEDNGYFLNEGLNKYKESFGGGTTLYETYQYQKY